jgi:hypothetical protein
VKEHIAIVGALLIAMLGCAMTELDGWKTPPSGDQAYVLSRRDSSKNGVLTVERILEYASTRTGERVEP